MRQAWMRIFGRGWRRSSARAEVSPVRASFRLSGFGRRIRPWPRAELAKELDRCGSRRVPSPHAAPQRTAVGFARLTSRCRIASASR
jgi:hypothetical protein